jgi:hypothetical protein
MSHDFMKISGYTYENVGDFHTKYFEEGWVVPVFEDISTAKQKIRRGRSSGVSNYTFRGRDMSVASIVSGSYLNTSPSNYFHANTKKDMEMFRASHS